MNFPLKRYASFWVDKRKKKNSLPRRGHTKILICSFWVKTIWYWNIGFLLGIAIRFEVFLRKRNKQNITKIIAVRLEE